MLTSGKGGDFNAPHINWPMLDVTPLAGTHRQIYQRLIDISLYHNIEQIIDKPTRGDNILDLFLTNNKSALNNFETLPRIGKAENDIVYNHRDQWATRSTKYSSPQRIHFSESYLRWNEIETLYPPQLPAKHYRTNLSKYTVDCFENNSHKSYARIYPTETNNAYFG